MLLITQGTKANDNDKRGRRRERSEEDSSWRGSMENGNRNGCEEKRKKQRKRASEKERLGWTEKHTERRMNWPDKDFMLDVSAL